MSLPNLSSAVKFDRIGLNLSEINFDFLKHHHVLFAFETTAFTLFGIALALSFYFAANALILPPKIANSFVATNLDPSSPLTLSFDRPFSRQGLSYTISPTTAGYWKFSNPFLPGHLYRQIEFVPTETLEPHTTYTISVNNLHSIFSLSGPSSFTFEGQTASLPRVKKVSPELGSQTLLPNQTIKVDLDMPNSLTANFNFSFSPDLKFTSSLSSDRKTYLIVPLENFKQGTDYQLKIEKFPTKYDLTKKSLLTKGAASLESTIKYHTLAAPTVNFSSQGQTASTGAITLTFSKDMDKVSVQKNLSFSPDFAKTLLWTEGKNLTVTPTQNLAFSTFYNISLETSAFATDGTFTESKIVNSFTTIGNVKVISFSPGNGSTGVGIQTGFAVSFDQPVDKTSAQTHFSISPSVNGTFSWSGNTMVFAPGGLSNNQSYTIKMASGVKSLAALDSALDFSSSFKTVDLFETIVLSVPRYAQKYTLSCEFANMRMALAFKGVNKTEDELIAETAFDNTPHSGNTWGDPSVGFVGDVNGTYFGTGYGAYHPVVSAELAKYRPVETHVGWDISSLAAEVKAGNPVIIWGCTYCIGPVYWTTTGGKQIYAYQYYHMYTVVGYVGSVANPTSLVVNNSISGTQQTLSRSQFLAKWSIMNNTAVVVK